MNKNKKGMGAGAMVGMGAGVAALSIAAYLLFGPKGKQNRKAVRSWAVKMKGDIIEKLEEAKEITEPMYNNIVDQVQAKYATFQNVDQKELASLITEIRKHWKQVVKESKSNNKNIKSKTKTKSKLKKKVNKNNKK